MLIKQAVSEYVPMPAGTNWMGDAELKTVAPSLQEPKPMRLRH